MLVDARQIPDGSAVEADVCIIGGGAAGITIAREFADAGQRVCVLESGGLEPDAQTQSLYNGENIGFPYYDLATLRLRFLGGTTNHWVGVCRPLDEIDFQPRQWVAYSGWPFDKSHLDPYYERAHEVCQVGPYDYELDNWADDSWLPLEGDRVATTVAQRSPPTRFGAVYRELLERSENVHTYLHANAVDIVGAESGREITHVRCAVLDGGQFTVSAKEFILATGAIENARLLLNSNTVQKDGLGNDHDLVGRFFMEHLSVPGSLFMPSNPELPLEPYMRDGPLAFEDGTRALAYLTLTPQTLTKERLLNVRAYIRPANNRQVFLGTSRAAGSLRSIRSSIGTDPGLALEHVANVARDVDDIAMYLYRRSFRPSLPVNAYWLYNHIEQVPNPDSRITLDTERDVTGLNRVLLNWQFGDQERATYTRVQEIMGEELGRARLGRVRTILDDPETGWPSVNGGLRGAWHQMGTTRMHLDPRQGVVDENCRIHSIGNLYLAGSSVFPTSGYTNPTLTIVALAIRLSDHIKNIMG